MIFLSREGFQYAVFSVRCGFGEVNSHALLSYSNKFYRVSSS